jgi:hypothetical protein
MFNYRKGISLIVLVITIIIIIILAGSVILSLSKNNPIKSATEATFKSNISSYESELSIYISKQYASTVNNIDLNSLNASTDIELRQYIKSIPDADLYKYKIIRGKLIYLGTSADEIIWAKEVNVAPVIVSDGLVLYLDASNTLSYPGSGSIWYDLSGNGNNVTLYNSPVYNASRHFIFNGTTQYAKTTNTLNLSACNAVTVFQNVQFTSYPVSGSYYILHELSDNYNGYTDSFVASANDPSAGQNWDLAVGVKGNIGYSTDMWSKTYLNDLQWKNLAMQYNMNISAGKETSFFVNGEKKTSLSVPTLSSDNNGTFSNRPLYIFSRGGTSNFAPGKLSLILVYNRALSDSEVLQNYYALKDKY